MPDEIQEEPKEQNPVLDRLGSSVSRRTLLGGAALAIGGAALAACSTGSNGGTACDGTTPDSACPASNDQSVIDTNGVGGSVQFTLLTPLAAAISSTARCKFPPMVAGASKSTTPSRVVRNADT